MWTFCRAKSRRPSAFVVAGVALCLAAGCQSRPANQGSLYTPVREGQAIGPVPPPPVAFYPYEPKEVLAFDELPAEVRAKSVAHVKARVGAEFYRRLRFAGARVIDLDALHRINPASRAFQPEVPTFLLRYEFSLPEAGVRRYTASLALRRDGTPLREIDLPAFAADPGKLRLRPLREISALLARSGRIDPAATTASVTYDQARDTLVWHFEQTLPSPGVELKTKTVDVDARTGAEIRG